MQIRQKGMTYWLETTVLILNVLGKVQCKFI